MWIAVQVLPNVADWLEQMALLIEKVLGLPDETPQTDGRPVELSFLRES